MTTKPDLDQARQVADTITQSPKAYDPGMQATARVIASLPDEWIDADEVRELAFDMDNWDDLSGPDEDRVLPMVEKLEGFAKRLNALLPTPKPRTLADMTREEREACQWMQATFTKTHHEHIITAVYGNKARLLRKADGLGLEVPHAEVVPLPDLPRMEWPDEHHPAADLHRIRTQLEALRDDVLRVSEKWNHTSADGDRPLNERVEASIKIGTANAIAMRISEILDGDTDE